MRIRVLEWIGLIMTDQLAFLVVAISFLYVFTDPVKEAKSQQLAQQTIQKQQEQIQTLENTVKALKIQGNKSSKKSTERTPDAQVHVRLFPGTLVVAAGGGDFFRMNEEELMQLLKSQVTEGKKPEVILSAETGMTYTQLTALADEIKKHNIPVQFGW